MGFQSIERGVFLWMLHRFPYNIRQRKLVIGRSFQQRIFHEHFSNEDCGIGSFQIISIFITFWSLTKLSEDCHWINLVGLLSMEPFPLHCNCVKWSPLAFPSVKWFFFFFNRVEGSFHRSYFVGNNFHEISMDEIEFGCFQIDSSEFQGLSSNWDNFQETFFNETNY